MRVTILVQETREAHALLQAFESAGLPSAATTDPGQLETDVLACDLRRSDAPSPPLGLAQNEAPLCTVGLCAHAAGPLQAQWLDGCIPWDQPANLLRRRLEEAWRDAVARRELQDREETLRQAACAWSTPVDTTGCGAVLFAGRPLAGYFEIEAALAAQGLRLEAALSIASAFDRLHEAGDIEALIVNLEGAEESGLALCGALRRNTRLAGLPVAAVTGSASLQRAAFGKGVLEAAEPGALARIGLFWIADAVRLRRARRLVVARLQAAQAALAKPQLFSRHAQTLAGAHALGARRLSAAAIQLSPRSSSSAPKDVLHRQRNEAFDMVRGMIRTSDLSCRLSEDVLAMLLPATPLVEAEALLRRCVAVLESTGYDGAGSVPEVRRSVCELVLGESGTALLRRTLAGLRDPAGKVLARGPKSAGAFSTKA